jgi:cyclopropane fatty-acyl-phospholipid synthase-like methyltransferase
VGAHRLGAGALRAYFATAENPRASDAEIAWYRAHLQPDAGTSLELMCGNGRLLAPLIEAGMSVHGLDASAPMLAECDARLSAITADATLFRQDISELNVPFRYGAAFIACGSFQSLAVDRANVALLRIRAHLVEPGLLLLDLYVPSESAQRIAAPLVEVRSATLADGSRIALRSETTMYPDARLARIETRYVHRRGHDLIAEESEAAAVTWYTPDDITALLLDAGYRDVAIGQSPRPDTGDQTFSVTARG